MFYIGVSILNVCIIKHCAYLLLATLSLKERLNQL